MKLFVVFCSLVSGNELVERSLPLCGQEEAWFGQTSGTISSDSPYDDSYKCRWTIDGMTPNGKKSICIRFSQFDIEDDRKCRKSVVELSYGNMEPERFCQTLGADRDRHKRMRMVQQKTFNSGNPRKARAGQNYLTWTCLDTHKLTIQMASHPGANAAGNYLGFKLDWATESNLKMADLKADLASFGSSINYFDSKTNKKIQRKFGRLVPKLNRTLNQGQTTCSSTMEYAPEFLAAAWADFQSENTASGLKFFLQTYTEVLHVGCYKRYGKIVDKTLSRFTDELL